MHLICLKAFVNFHKETLFKNTLFMEINCMWLNFLKRNHEQMILSMPDLTQKKREKQRFSLFFFYSLQN